jgi:hypothetical protein
MNKLLTTLLLAVTVSGCSMYEEYDEVTVGTLVSIDHKDGQELSGSISGSAFGFSGSIEGHQSVNYYMMIELADGSIVPCVVNSSKVRIVPSNSLKVKASVVLRAKTDHDLRIVRGSLQSKYRTPGRLEVNSILRDGDYPLDESLGCTAFTVSRIRTKEIILELPMESIQRYIRVN